MITSVILQALFGMVQIILWIFPDVPPMPEGIVSGTDYIIALIGQMIGVVSYILSPTILIFSLTTILIIINFESIYHLLQWVVRKLPIGSN